MTAVKGRRKKSVRIKNLWSVRVRHRDYAETKNGWGGLRMTETSLWIVAPQIDTRPNIDTAISRARAFLNRHQRRYSIYTILQVEHRGTIDN